MLVIISDLHLTDGTSGETISAGTPRIFRQRLSDMAYDASKRSDGTYRPVESIDLLLLGDIFDAIRSTRWVFDAAGKPVSVRPWDPPNSPAFIAKLNEITDGIIENNAESLAVLRGYTGERPVTIPPATRSGRPRKVSHNQDAKSRQPVPMRIHYMVGNHDWFYHLPGVAHNAIRQKVADAIGLTTPAAAPFPHDPAESDVLPALMRQYNLFARHGDIFDPFNFEGNRDAPSLGDAVVVELLNRFPSEVDRRMKQTGVQLPQACLDGLREMDNVRPTLLIPVWLNSLLQRTVPDKKKIDWVKDIWDDVADDFLKHPFVRARDKRLDFFDTVDQLEWALKFSKGLSLDTMSRVVTWFKSKFGSGPTTHHQNAFTEDAFINKKARFIVHGHTHLPEIVALDSEGVGQNRIDQLYLNSGTWRRVHEMAQFDKNEQEFMGFHVMTYFSFYKGDERKGRSFETWTGNLGVD